MACPTRAEARELLNEWVVSESLRRHCLAVEAAMRAMARHYGGEEERWGIAGLLHDFDYERYPDPRDHPLRGVEELRARGYPEDVIEAILGHASYSGVPRASRMAKCLFAVDELSGFLLALARVRPRGFVGMEPESVEKNLKKKGFAAAINREEIARSIEELGADRREHLARVIAALGEVAGELSFPSS